MSQYKFRWLECGAKGGIMTVRGFVRNTHVQLPHAAGTARAERIQKPYGASTRRRRRSRD
jgi:hypothetical protein